MTDYGFGIKCSRCGEYFSPGYMFYEIGGKKVCGECFAGSRHALARSEVDLLSEINDKLAKIIALLSAPKGNDHG